MPLNGEAAPDWAGHEDKIKDLFITQNKTLKDVVAYMKDVHNFQATERQYKHRFPNLKNVKAQEWIWIGQEMQRRAAIGKESEPCLLDRPLPLDRVIRGISRHQTEAHAATLSHQVSNPSPLRITVRTPPPRVDIASCSNLNHPDNLLGNEADDSTFQSLLQESSSTQTPFGVSLMQELPAEFDAAMEIDPGIGEITSHIDMFTEWAIQSEFTFSMAHSSSPGMVMRRTPSSSNIERAEPQFSARGLSPFSQFIDLENLDTHSQIGLMTDLPYFRLLSIIEQSGCMSPQINTALQGASWNTTNSSNLLLIGSGRDVLSDLVGLNSELQLHEAGSKVTSRLQQILPERFRGELSDKVSHLLSPRSTGSSSLSFLFELAAFFASNNTLGNTRMDNFLKWIIDQRYTDYLEQFLQINTSTIHAFATHILKSAVRIKNVRFLTALLDRGVKFDTILNDILSIGDAEFTKLVFSRVGPTSYKGERGALLFHRLVKENNFELVQILALNGVDVDCRLQKTTPLWEAVSRGNIRTIKVLLDLGADVNATVNNWSITNSALGLAIANKNAEIVALLLDHKATISCQVDGKDVLEWSSLHCRNIYQLIKAKASSTAYGVTTGDLIYAAEQGGQALRAYIHDHQGQITQHQLERALDESVRLDNINATVVLLQHGVSPDCHTLKNRPLQTALNSQQPRTLCDLLLQFEADVNLSDVSYRLVRDIKLLRKFVKSGFDLEAKGAEALVQAASWNYAASAAFLIKSGVNIDTPGLEFNPLQAAAAEPFHLEMIELLLSHGANINAPAHVNGGRTALQSALGGESDLEVASILLDKGADIFAPPAPLGGVTALEAVCHRWDACAKQDKAIPMCNWLLGLGAPVNRPNNEGSSVLHGVIDKQWREILARILNSELKVVIDHMWCDESMEEEDDYVWEPRTPTQLAAENGHLDYVKMLVDHGAAVNEDPADRYGRTALQAAASSGYIDVVRFLVEQGADINAKPAVHGGITALQGAAISGKIILAKFLLDHGALVNAAPSFCEGRYAIEGAAEHGRLDMVKMLLNAGAKGNVFRGTGFKYAIELAEENEHFAIANLLGNVT